MTLTIRRASLDDAATAADIYMRSRQAAVPAIPPIPAPDDDVPRWWREEVFKTAEVWLAEGETGDPLAVMVLEDEWLDQLYVVPGRTGEGIGTALLEFAKSKRPTGLQLWAFESNVNARRFYERHGFVAIDRTDGDNMEKAPDVLYVWKPKSA